MGKNKRRNKKKEKRLRLILFSSIFVLISGSIFYIVSGDKKDESLLVSGNEIEKEDKLKEEKVVKKEEIIITAAGDCTLGTDTNFNYSSSLNAEVANSGNDYGTLMKNVKEIFEKDDYTIVNLETTFTESNEKLNKGEGITFNFKGPKEFVNILKEGNIEGVTISNNHIYDYGQKGFTDTVNTLKEANVDFCGEGYKILKEIKGIKVAFLGYQGWMETEELKSKIKADIEEMRDKGALLVIPYFHWGIERANKPYDVQVNLARFSIDNGADMVLGSHPHVMQSIENYKGKMIVYSLGNFSFGGNSNPVDKRTFMVQMKFKFEDDKNVGAEYRIIPASISSVKNRNDYRPTPSKGEEKKAILKELNNLSETLNGKISDNFFTLK
ncbi:CapA family protein [Clostridium thermobutyricum]|uniref:CapA family protein n=1 Tax=Clostridium thermobutyricum TaxID=29372 RepID=UPI0029422F6A|nr:CapA family protein [Clostridium thermobutyricum]